MSVRAYAAHLGVAVATVSNWDSRGERARLNTETQQLLDIDLNRASDDVRERFAAILVSEADEMKRRAILITGGVAMVGTLAAAAIPGTKGAARISPQLSDTITRLGRAILAPAPGATTRQVSAVHLAAAAKQAWFLRQRAQYEVLATLLSDLIPEAEAGAAGLNDEESRQARATLVHVYNAASSLLKRLGDDSLAPIAADRATRAAQTLDDPALLAAAHYRVANVLLAGGRADQAQDVALAAADLVDPSSSRSKRSLSIWGGLLLTAAVAAARKPDRSRAWQLLGEARAAGYLLGRDHADMYAIFGPSNVAIHGVQVALELGDGGEAVRRSQQVDPNDLPDSLIERRGQFLIDLAQAHLLTSDADRAAAAILDAERVAPQEVQLNVDAHWVVRRLLSYPRVGRGPELRALVERVSIDS
jgi:hypothetical protein